MAFSGERPHFSLICSGGAQGFCRFFLGQSFLFSKKCDLLVKFDCSHMNTSFFQVVFISFFRGQPVEACALRKAMILFYGFTGKTITDWFDALWFYPTCGWTDWASFVFCRVFCGLYCFTSELIYDNLRYC